ncbi:radical SAM protein [Taibaiella soli]|uniref:Radical SAM protein n=1 Tax=Taibaiella soli TaxID=1649169 RepID=A0A2W2AUY1_9BACT|nr:radical SAM protein [Taibaiella soli]PZF71764.1 radical SAM protein [Taibaiella soli]
MDQKIPFQILNSQILALFPDGEVEFVDIKLLDDIISYNDHLLSEINYKPYILTDIIFTNDRLFTPAPLIAFIEITNLCNLKCKHCYANSQYRRKNEMSTSMIFQLLDEFGEMGVLQVFLTGGEIFTHKDAVEIINYAATKNFTTQVFTNGILLTEQIVASLPGNIGLAISFDTADPVKTVRGKMDYPKLKQTFELLNKFKIPFRTAISVHKYNIQDIIETYEWSIKNNYPRPQWLETFATGRALKNKHILPTEENFKEIFEVYKTCMDKFCTMDNADELQGTAIESIHAIKTIQMVERLEIATGKPKLANTMVYVNSSGDVYPDSSCLDYEDFIGGSLYDLSFFDIWTNAFKELRKNSFTDFKGCDKCPINVSGIHCNFRDYGLSQNLHGDPFYCGASDYIKLMILRCAEYWKEKDDKGYKLKLLIN